MSLAERIYDFRHWLEALALKLVFVCLRLLPLDAASWLGGKLGEFIGPKTRGHKVATQNLDAAFPEKSAEEKQQILRGMWNNLGRVAGEMPHVAGEKIHGRVAITGGNNLPDKDTQMLFFSGHLGNWELTYPTAYRLGFPIALVYRHINNHYTEEYIRTLRSVHSTQQIAKGGKGAITLVRALKSGTCVALLVDQKMNDGIAIPFFGRNAMTAPAIAQLALKFNLPIIPAQCVRTGGAHFEMRAHPALTFEKTGDEDADVRSIMTQINALLEGWIREHPEQWFWVHNRWPK